MSRYKAPLSLRPVPSSEVPDTAMVMAAGLGKRMRPLTATRPKPLIEVRGQTLLDHTLEHLKASGVRRAVVNVHYLADAIEAHLRNRVQGLDITVSDERERLLETGGGLVHALPLIEADTFFVVNSDNIWVDGPVDSLRLLASGWEEEKMDALLLLVPFARAFGHGGQGDFHMDAAGRLRRRKRGAVAPFVFTGIQIVSKRLFEGEMPEGAFSTNILWDRAMEAGRCFGAVHQGLWFDVGTPENVKRTQELLSDA